MYYGQIILSRRKVIENMGTAYNKQYALRRRQAAAQGSKNRSRRFAALCGFLSPTFQPTANLRFALKGGLERRIFRTLYAILPEMSFYLDIFFEIDDK